VEQVSWNDIQGYIQKLNAQTGKQYRLPTEAEWEYAAGGGLKCKMYTYSGSNDLSEVGWYVANSQSKTHSIGRKQPNELGIYDMSGNVMEWCNDWYATYSSEFENNPTGPEIGQRRVLRGGRSVGSWKEALEDALQLYINRTGKKMSQESFLKELKANPKSLSAAFKFFRDAGYSGELKGFECLIGLAPEPLTENMKACDWHSRTNALPDQHGGGFGIRLVCNNMAN
jgi:formylglycine-generating enzyme required for sulfatase activity